MRSVLTNLTLALALGASSTALAAERLPLGSAAPEAGVMMETTAGTKVSIASVKGAKGTLVVFTCNHCPWAKAWEQRVAVAGNAALGQGFGVVAINPNDPAKVPEDALEPMKERAQALGLKFPYAVDATSGIAKAFGATKTPEVFLFDAAGKLVYTGAVDDNAEKPAEVKQKFLEQALASVAAGKPVASPETKAIGCSIKWRGK
jgi:peroxiredoxin